MSLITTIEQLTEKPRLPEVTVEVAEGLCAHHLNEWSDDFYSEAVVLSMTVTRRVLTEGSSAFVEMVAAEAVRLFDASAVLATERAKRAGIIPLEKKP